MQTKTEIENRESIRCTKYYSSNERIDNLNKYLETLEADYKADKSQLKQDFLYNKYCNILEYLFTTKQLANIQESKLIQLLKKH
jgi:hypothetical protein